MIIGFFDPSLQDFTPDTPYERALGGTQSAICYLATALADRGHDVRILCGTSRPGMARGVQCLAPPFMIDDFNRLDVLVVATKPLGRDLRQQGVTKPIVLWQHMQSSASAFKAETFSPAERASWAGVAFVSEHQRETFRRDWNVDGHVMRNGISPMVAETEVRRSRVLQQPGSGPVLIYASAPGRGLDNLLIIFPTIRAAYPEARLRIFSDLALYNVPPERDPYRTYYTLARALPGVDYVGSVSQQRLAAEFADADMLAYPTIHEETSCIVAMEAMASACLISTTDYGALRETCGTAADYIGFTRERRILCTNFADMVVDAVGRARAAPDETFGRLSDNAARVRSECSWASRAAEWEKWLLSLV